jgi:hypothetical protein
VTSGSDLPPQGNPLHPYANGAFVVAGCEQDGLTQSEYYLFKRLIANETPVIANANVQILETVAVDFGNEFHMRCAT